MHLRQSAEETAKAERVLTLCIVKYNSYNPLESRVRDEAAQVLRAL